MYTRLLMRETDTRTMTQTCPVPLQPVNARLLCMLSAILSSCLVLSVPCVVVVVVVVVVVLCLSVCGCVSTTCACVSGVVSGPSWFLALILFYFIF
ncbi:hypothetical protein F5Y14DRAFT_309460 [Nemania sp. NC0429]|nr:hypothetical protein F5Y14DRAFT_309460 [Nemania sp. NC0429]